MAGSNSEVTWKLEATDYLDVSPQINKESIVEALDLLEGKPFAEGMNEHLKQIYEVFEKMGDKMSNLDRHIFSSFTMDLWIRHILEMKAQEWREKQQKKVAIPKKKIIIPSAPAH